VKTDTAVDEYCGNNHNARQAIDFCHDSPPNLQGYVNPRAGEPKDSPFLQGQLYKLPMLGKEMLPSVL
jgi:hypothetical protein